MTQDLLKGDEQVQLESVNQFCDWLKNTWDTAQRNLKKAIETQAKYYDTRHRPVTFAVGQLVLLNTINLRIKNTPTKLKRKFVGLFRVVECIGTQSYRLALLANWRIHPMFHVSLLKAWHESVFV